MNGLGSMFCFAKKNQSLLKTQIDNKLLLIHHSQITIPHQHCVREYRSCT